MFLETTLAQVLNPLPDDKILDQTKLKAFADNKLNVTKVIISVFDRVENIVGKRRNCLYKQFLLFPQCFQKASFPKNCKKKHDFQVQMNFSTQTSLIATSAYNRTILCEKVASCICTTVCVGSGQPEQSTKTDLGQSSLLLVNFLILEDHSTS